MSRPWGRDAEVRCLQTLEHAGSVRPVALTPDAPESVGAMLRRLRGGVPLVALTPDGRLALTGDARGTARLWELSSGRCLHTLQGHTELVWSVGISADGRLALTGSDDGTGRLWTL